MKANTIDVSEKTYEEWRILRSSFLGGSDVATALSENPYKSSYMLWLEKTGRFSFDEDNPVMKFGRQWEDQVRKEFSRRSGFEVTEPDQMFVHPDPELGMLSANVDGIIQANEKHEKRGILEIKCTLRSRVPVLAEWDDVPVEYQYQIMHYLSVTGLEYAYLQIYYRDECTYSRPLQIFRDESMITEMNQKLANWWTKYVEGDQPPPMSSEHNDLKIAYPDSEPDSSKQATDSILRSYNALKHVRERISQLKELKSSYEQDLKEYMGEAETLLDGEDRLATWKSSKRRRFSTSDFKDDYPELYKEYANTNQIRIFRIK